MSTRTTYRFVSGASQGWLKHFELAWRALGRAPSFTVPAVVTIALGIGAATAVFSLVYAILLRPFPYPDADRLVRVFTVAEGEQGAERDCSLLDIEEYNRRSSLLENIGGYTVFDSQILHPRRRLGRSSRVRLGRRLSKASRSRTLVRRGAGARCRVLVGRRHAHRRRSPGR